MARNMLIADADARLLESYRFYFESFGFDVTTAASCLDCLAELMARAYDVLILDRDLLRADEHGILAWLRQSSRGPAPETIFITGDEPRGLLAAATGLPTFHCFQKPFPFDTFLSALAEAPCLAGTPSGPAPV